jgi:hypothetical protein
MWPPAAAMRYKIHPRGVGAGEDQIGQPAQSEPIDRIFHHGGTLRVDPVGGIGRQQLLHSEPVVCVVPCLAAIGCKIEPTAKIRLCPTFG